MKSVLEDIKSHRGTSSFYAYKIEVPFFEFKMHHHPEYELTYIVKGSGYRWLGANYETYKAGDFVLLSSNIPHTWMSNPNQNESVEAIVIQFSQEFITPFLQFKESNAIATLLSLASKGLQLSPDASTTTALLELLSREGLSRILTFISLLEQIAQLPYRTIVSQKKPLVLSKVKETRLNKACTYIHQNFEKKITLSDLASMLFLSESNFCKFFKKATGNTFTEYVNEIRINEACRLLLQTDKTINEIVFLCGFENVSYFNRIFKVKNNGSPSQFRKLKNTLD